MNPNDFDLKAASLAYAVSNTPLFLVRKLQDNQSVHAINDHCSGEEILQALPPALSADPQGAVDAVRPFALLVALWYKPESRYLQEAAQIPAPHHPWYRYVASALIETFSPITKKVIDVPGCFTSPKTTISSSAGTTPTILTIPPSGR